MVSRGNCRKWFFSGHWIIIIIQPDLFVISSPFLYFLWRSCYDFACSYILLLPKVFRKDSEILPWYRMLQVFDFWIDEPISTASEDLAKKIFQSHGVRPSSWNAAHHGIRSSTPDPPFFHVGDQWCGRTNVDLYDVLCVFCSSLSQGIFPFVFWCTNDLWACFKGKKNQPIDIWFIPLTFSDPTGSGLTCLSRHQAGLAEMRSPGSMKSRLAGGVPSGKFTIWSTWGIYTEHALKLFEAKPSRSEDSIIEVFELGSFQLLQLAQVGTQETAPQGVPTTQMPNGWRHLATHDSLWMKVWWVQSTF